MKEARAAGLLDDSDEDEENVGALSVSPLLILFSLVVYCLCLITYYDS